MNPNDLDLRLLRSFLTVAQCGKIGKMIQKRDVPSRPGRSQHSAPCLAVPSVAQATIYRPSRGGQTPSFLRRRLSGDAQRPIGRPRG
jgi:hypothetical protein